MQTFKKQERLRSKKLIEQLFKQGNSFNIYPFKIIWIEADIKTNCSAQVLIGVSKKNLRRAVDRNKLKRRIRESYRKNKQLFYDYLQSKNVKLVLGIIHNGKDISKYKEIEQKIITVFNRLIEEHEKTTG